MQLLQLLQQSILKLESGKHRSNSSQTEAVVDQDGVIDSHADLSGPSVWILGASESVAYPSEMSSFTPKNDDKPVSGLEVYTIFKQTPYLKQAPYPSEVKYV